jgi:urease accessory protein
MAHSHSHDDAAHSHSHAHDTFNAAEHGHSHEILDGPGSYLGREMPLIEGRNWNERAFTIGIGGYVSLPYPQLPTDMVYRYKSTNKSSSTGKAQSARARPP